MTKLTPGKVLTRETGGTFRGSSLVADFRDRTLTLRPKGTRQSIEATWTEIYEWLAWRAAKQIALQNTRLMGRRKRR
jgi:hypothetical protein